MSRSVGHAHGEAVSDGPADSAVATTACAHPGGKGFEHLQRLAVVTKQRMASPARVWQRRAGKRLAHVQPSPLPGHVGARWTMGAQPQGLQGPPPHSPMAEKQLRQRPRAQPPDGLPRPFDRPHRHAAAGPNRRLVIDAQHHLAHVAHAATQCAALLRPQATAPLVQHLHAHVAMQAQPSRQRAGGRQPLAPPGRHRPRPDPEGVLATAGDADPCGRRVQVGVRAR